MDSSVSEKGISYELKDFKGGGVQFLRFNTKSEDGTYVDGTTNEQVIHVLIKRLIQQVIKRPDPITQEAIDKLREAQQLLKDRTKKVRQEKNERYGRKKG